MVKIKIPELLRKKINYKNLFFMRDKNFTKELIQSLFDFGKIIKTKLIS